LACPFATYLRSKQTHIYLQPSHKVSNAKSNPDLLKESTTNLNDTPSY